MIISYTPEAVEDLQRLRAFIAEKNPASAQKIAAELLAGIAKLKDLPNLGRKAAKAPNPEMMRDLSVSLYIVRYLILDDEIHILRIWHKREN
ncbi:MAG: type II toxin-antitoxin system RelE/ParE family toxin [Methylomicrobium sp.]